MRFEGVFFSSMVGFSPAARLREHSSVIKVEWKNAVMNRKLRKLLRDPKRYFLDMKALAPVWSSLGVQSAIKPKIVVSPVVRSGSTEVAMVNIDQFSGGTGSCSPVEGSQIAIPGWEAFDLIGNNWIDGTDKLVLVLFGFNPWKRNFVSEYLSDYRTAYVRGNTSSKTVFAALEEKSVEALVVWGRYSKIDVADYSGNVDLPVWRMEDGFLRSTTLGSVHSRPLSLVLDKTGIYFDSTRPSDLENMLADSSGLASTDMKARAQHCIDLITHLRLSKYNGAASASALAERNSVYSILVVGQVEDDASIVYGCNRAVTNNDLIRQARADYPDARIIFRAHPDVAEGHRQQRSDPADVISLCEMANPGVSLADALESVDHVYTITSLSGFEALIRGKKVTVLGLPFYSGWGGLDARQHSNRRNVERSILDIFAAAYIRYPAYLVGSLGHESQIEHAILALYLQTLGCSDAIAADLAACFSYDEINAKLCEKICALLHKSSIAGQIFVNCHSMENFPVFVRSVLYGNSITDSLIELCHKEPALPGVFESALLSAKSERRLEALGVLKSLPTEVVPVSSASAYVRVLLVSGNIDSAERFVHEKLTLTASASVDELLVLTSLFGGIYVEQGRFGRKPFLASTVVDAIFSWVPIFADHDSGPVLLARAMEYFTHQRQWQLAIKLSEKLVADPLRYANVTRWTALQLVVIRAFTARFKRPELSLQVPYEYARRIFARMEGELSSRHLTAPMHFALLADLAEAQIVLAQPSDSLSYAQVAYKIALSRKKFTKLEQRRIKTIVSRHYAFFARTGRYADALEMLASLRPRLTHEYYFSQAASAHMVSRNYDIAEQLLRSLIITYKKPAYTKRLAVLMERKGKLAVAIALIEQLKRTFASNAASSWKEQEDLQDDLERLYFLRKSDEILKTVPQPKFPKGVVFVTSAGCLNSISMMVPILRELKKRGYAVIQVDEGMLPNEPTGLSWIDEHSGVVPRTLPPDVDFSQGLQNEWTLGWSERQMISQGINFYQGIFETMSMRIRAFNFDINDRGPLLALKRCLVASDRAVSVCMAIKRTVMARGMPVRFINAASHGAPYSVYRAFAQKEAENYDVGFVHIGQAYENYYSNLTGKLASTVCLDNMTAHPGYRMPFLARRDLFEKWLESDDQYAKYKGNIERLLTMNRVGRDADVGPNHTEQKLIEFRSAGRKIIGVYGKILCDMAVPYDGGAAHSDIVDWLRHTVSAAKKTKNVFVLKPHPHEFRPEIARDVNEFWLDLINKTDLPENVIALPHDGFNNQDLIPLLDLAVLWNGTSSLELLAQGVPVMMASYFGKLDYPIDMIYPTSRSHYEDIISSEGWDKPSRETMIRSALLLVYMGTEEVSVPFKYSYRPVTNDPVGVPFWHEDEIDALIASGDSHITKLVDKIF